MRPILGDRLAVTLVNRSQINPDHFESRSDRSVSLTEEGRRTAVIAYQERKADEVSHPVLKAQAAARARAAHAGTPPGAAASRRSRRLRVGDRWEARAQSALRPPTANSLTCAGLVCPRLGESI